jgi:transcriptional regulator with XRE-family HTH domain
MDTPSSPLGVLAMMKMALPPRRATISRYELGEHQPPEKTALLLAKVLGVPHAYQPCENDRLAEIILTTSELPVSDQEQMLRSLHERLDFKLASARRK